MNIKRKASFFLSQVFKQERGAGCYLFHDNSTVPTCCWSIWSDFKDVSGMSYIRSGSNGPRCVANPENKKNKRLNQNDWAFYKAGEDDVMAWEEGGVVVHCTVHDQTSAN